MYHNDAQLDSFHLDLDRHTFRFYAQSWKHYVLHSEKPHREGLHSSFRLNCNAFGFHPKREIKTNFVIF